jgi:hypothetical protein
LDPRLSAFIGGPNYFGAGSERHDDEISAAPVEGVE